MNFGSRHSAAGMPWLILLLTLIGFGAGFAQTLPDWSESWDTTSIDVHGEVKSLDGAWQFVQGWEDLSKPPSFANATPQQVPSQVEGAYRTTFTVQSGTGLKRDILRFDAVAFRCTIFVNGKKVAEHAGGLTPFEVDVTHEAHHGDNELIVLDLGQKGRALSAEATSQAKITYNDRAQAVATGGDKIALGGGMWPLDGIRQDVTFREVPLLRVADATLVTSVQKMTLSTSVNIANQTSQDENVSVQEDILPYDIPSKTIGDKPVWTKTENAMAKLGLTTVQIIQPWSDPQLWGVGDPHLYVARIRVLDATGNVLNERNIRFGFREIWLDGRKVIFNGKPIRFFTHGDPDSEAAPDTIRARFKQLMSVGINLVRAHTRPPLPHYAGIADEMGMPIIAESEVCFNPNFAYEAPVFWDNHVRLYKERILRDKNHPSILIWSMANEVIISSPGAKGIGQHFHDSYVEIKKFDPTRPIMQEGDGDLRDMVAGSKGFPIDIINLHPYDITPYKNPMWANDFPPVAWIMEKAKTPKDIPATNKFGDELPDRSRPWFMGEFGLVAGGIYPDASSFWTGPETYRDLFGSAKALVASTGEITVIQVEAYRDQDMAEVDPWDTADRPVLAPYLLRAFEPVTTFSRDMYGHWTGGETASRNIVTLNDSAQSQNLTLTTILKEGDRELNHKDENFTLAPGTKQKTAWTFELPKVDKKTPAKLVVQLHDEKGKQISGFEQNWLIYPEQPPTADWQGAQVWLCGTEDNLGAISKWSGVRLKPSLDVEDLVHDKPDLVILDRTMTAPLSDTNRHSLETYVKAGGALMLLGFDEVPFGTEHLVTEPNCDSTRLFMQRSSPLTTGTTRQDWEFWRPDHMMTHGPYTMSFDPQWEFPIVSGGRNGPLYPPLGVLKIENGVVIGCRLQLNQAVSEEPAARLFLNNLIAYAKTLRNETPKPSPTLALICPPGEVADWKKRFDAARIPFRPQGDEPLVPKEEIVFLTGNATPSPAQLDQLTGFMRDGGALWLHRLTPQTSYLDHVRGWLGQTAVTMRAPVMWLQQLELVTPEAPGPMLDGINDYHTCWATFGWTNGDMNTVRTTPIADYVLTDLGTRGQPLLKEADYLGKWNEGPGGYELTQAMLRELGTHPKNDKPGIGLAIYPAGKGGIIVDQLRWDQVMLDSSSESKDKARYFGGTLWKNIVGLATP